MQPVLNGRISKKNNDIADVEHKHQELFMTELIDFRKPFPRGSPLKKHRPYTMLLKSFSKVRGVFFPLNDVGHFRVV